MTNINPTYNAKGRIEKEKVSNHKYLGQTIIMENRTRQEVLMSIKAGWSVFGNIGRYFWAGAFP